MKSARLYAITSEALCRNPQRLSAAVEAALRGGTRLIQYRDKWNEPAVKQGLAANLRVICHAHDAKLIINDDVALAAACGADGVHLGKTDAGLETARAALGPQALIGVTCHDDVARARALQERGADYVAFGRFYPSQTKPDAPPAALSVLTAARTQLHIPICAIGGITPEHVPEILAAGADWVAVVDGIFGAANIETAARAYCLFF